MTQWIKVLVPKGDGSKLGLQNVEGENHCYKVVHYLHICVPTHTIIVNERRGGESVYFMVLDKIITSI